ncbi:DivIVA domain-containing protein [Micromonospora lupini]|uniref:DivIVA domain-containing protein n=1 Tax=Micromonospora lupini TaxID=285679 RepID=UPI002256336D|nr:DivIVA domain-containing protein [Micromonospora lupini]MCX5069050.1 DivIVA domain-containing protein [Micromonospora lupini]
MGQLLLLLVVALTVAAVVFGVTVLVSGRDPGLASTEPDSQAIPLPATRPLRESDVGAVRFDTGLRGYRMAQVDQAMRRAAYDIGYKSELIGVLEAEVIALREGRTDDADALRQAREQAAGAVPDATAAEPDETAAPAEGTAADDGTVPAEADALPAATSSAADSDGVAPAESEPTAAHKPTDDAPAADAPTARTPSADEPAGDEPAGDAGQHGAVVRSESA